MKVCPKCGAPVSEAAPYFCVQCGTQLLIKKVPSLEPTVVGPESAGVPPISPTPITPTPIEPTPIQPTAIETTAIEPTPIQATPIEPTVITPTPIEPTVIRPTEIKPTAIKPFVFKVLLSNAVEALLAAIALAITLALGLTSFISWLFFLISAFVTALGLVGVFKEIMKLPINQALLDAFNSKLKPGQPPVTQANLSKIQKIQFRIMTATTQIKVVSLASIGVTALIVLISVISAAAGGAGGPTTTITGTWYHELGIHMGDSTWVVNVTMWSVEESDPGYVYTNVSQDGTFNVTYNSTEVSYGTWQETGNNNYEFLYHDPADILYPITVEYQIRGNDLVQGYGPSSVYCTKQ